MKKLNLLPVLLFAALLISGMSNINAQVTPCLDFVGGPYVDIQNPPCDIDCGDVLEAGFDVWENEAYLLNAQAGNEYTFEFCTGYSAAIWSAIITVAESDGEGGAVADSEIATAAGCSITFVTPETKVYLIIVSGATSCGGAYNQEDNGAITIQCCSDQPATDTCYAGEIISADTILVCPGDTGLVISTEDQVLPTGGAFVWLFNAGAGATGGVPSFSITGSSPGEFEVDEDIGGILSANMLDPLAGPWSIRTGIRTADTITCFSSSATVLVFLGEGDPNCVEEGCDTVDIELTAVVTDESVEGEGDGAIDLTVGGNGTPDYKYSWDNGDTTQDLTGLEPGDYTVQVTDANGCEAEATFTVEAGIDPCDTITIILEADITDESVSGANDGAIDLEVSGNGVEPYTYFWSNAEITQDISGLAPGNYTVLVSDSIGCQKQQTFTVNPGSVGIDDIASLEFFNVYPNPAKDVLYVDIRLNSVEEVSLEVFNLGGQELISFPAEKLSEKMFQLDLSTLTSGTYMVNIRVNNDLLSRSINILK